MSEFLQVEKRGRIAILRMSKPEAMNALSTIEDADNIVATLERLNFDRSVSVVILTGSGRAFSAGGDLKCGEKSKACDAMQECRLGRTHSHAKGRSAR